MFDTELYSEIWQAITKNKWRSTLTAFGVFWGLFMFVALAGAGNGLQNGMNQVLDGFATNAAFMWTENTTKPYKGLKKGRYWEFDNEDMFAITNQIKEIEYLVPRLQGWNLNRTTNCINGERYGTFSIQGDYPQLVLVEPFKMSKGRFLNDIDIIQRRKVCVIGPRVEEVLFAPGQDPIGKYIKVAGIYFQVIGVTKVDGNIQITYDKREAVHIPFSTMQNAYNYGNNVHYFSFTAHPQYEVAEIEEKVMALLKKRHDVDPTDIGAIGHVNVQRQFQMSSKLFTGIDILTFIVGFGTLLAGVIGISNIMLVIVKERTKEIGIKRALGATPFNIIKQILLESVFLTLTAGYFGLLLGILLNEGLGFFMSKNPDAGMFINPGIDLSQGIMSLFILVVAGAFAGLLPAQRAIRVKPIDAIREE